MAFTIGVVIGSALQLAAGVRPVVVFGAAVAGLIGYFFGRQLHDISQST
jgi:high-affinity Fe2+/Pb2+ permease